MPSAKQAWTLILRVFILQKGLVFSGSYKQWCEGMGQNVAEGCSEAVRGQDEQEEPTGQVKRNFQKTLKCKKVWSVWGTEGREVGPREVFYVVGGRQGPTGSVGPCMLHRKWRRSVCKWEKPSDVLSALGAARESYVKGSIKVEETGAIRGHYGHSGQIDVREAVWTGALTAVPGPPAVPPGLELVHPSQTPSPEVEAVCLAPEAGQDFPSRP